MSDTTNSSSSASGPRHQAGWFDIRNVIGLLLLIYGLVLLVLGLFDASDSEIARAGGVNANLWAGIGIAAVGAFFMIWARVRPIVVDDDQLEKDRQAAEEKPPAH
ncbi:MAG: hypothetical protein H0T17_03070 [Propionibacteriales bacterium]|nr:hypothetical protein [Propionibacteriales bacterium]